LGSGGIGDFMEDIIEHNQLEIQLAAKTALLLAEHEASPAGILVVDQNTNILSFNTRFIDMWRIPPAMAEARLDAPVLQFVFDQIADPDPFLTRVKYLYDHPNEIGDDEILLRDGRTVERHSTSIMQPDGQYLGRVWFFHDITERKQAAERLQRTLEQTIQAMASIIEMRDPYTAGHGRQVAAISVAIANKMGLDAERVHGLHLAAIVHDLGKIAVPAEILCKPSHLTPIEYQLVKTHVRIGYDVLRAVEFPWPIADIVHQHHERLDGSGYPEGLSGDTILLEAKILAVADVVDSMISHRPYRAGLGLEATLAEIQKHSGQLYDPAVALACLQVMREV
jgi:putative nucleotidyltransferase with HDIG domain